MKNKSQKYNFWKFFPNIIEYGFLGAIGEDVFATLDRHPKIRDFLFYQREEDTKINHKKIDYK